MSVTQRMRRKPRARMKSSRIGRMRTQSRRGASRTAYRIGPVAGQAREMTMERIIVARHWSAPRLERAGRYVERDLGPRVGMMLADTARRIAPARPQARRVRAASAMMMAAVVVAGVIGAVATRRNAVRDEAPMPAKPESQPTGNGQVRTP